MPHGMRQENQNLTGLLFFGSVHISATQLNARAATHDQREKIAQAARFLKDTV